MQRYLFVEGFKTSCWILDPLVTLIVCGSWDSRGDSLQRQMILDLLVGIGLL